VRGVAEFSAILAVTLGRMNSSTHSTKVLLFPLCDVHGVLINTLCDTSDSPGTHGDALILAWRLSLPKGMDVGKAAEAVLLVALEIPRKAWSEQQLLIVRELMLLTGRKTFVAPDNKNELRGGKHFMRRTRDQAANRDATDKAELAQKPVGLVADLGKPDTTPAKESKKWWMLVGRDPHG